MLPVSPINTIRFSSNGDRPYYTPAFRQEEGVGARVVRGFKSALSIIAPHVLKETDPPQQAVYYPGLGDPMVLYYLSGRNGLGTSLYYEA